MQIQSHVVPMYRRSDLRHMGRGRGCLFSFFAAALLMFCSCTACMAIYLIIPPPSANILIMGLDSRGNEGVVTRSDSIMVVGIKASRMKVSLLSIPRDLFINVPGYGLQRINTINVLGEMDEAGTGPDLLARSIEQSFGIGINYYVRLDFQAFVALVDALGGLDIDVPYTITDYQFPTDDYGTTEVHFDAGPQHMDGKTALIYARTRHADDDYHRAERQQLVVTALAKKLINPLNWPIAWYAIQQNTETNLNPLTMFWLLPPSLVGAFNMNRLVIDRDYILPGDGYSVPNYDTLKPFITENFD